MINKEFTLLNPVIKFSLQEMLDLHKEKGKRLLYLYFQDEFCHKLLEDTQGLKKVQVIVSERFKYEYRKQNLEVVR